MEKNRTSLVSLFAIGFAGIMALTMSASAEMYVAGQAGVNFADRINSIAGTGGQAGVPDLDPRPNPDFDLQTSITFGGKIGYFPGHSWYGIEGEVFHTTPHIKSLDPEPGVHNPGIHMRVTTVGVNFIARYPGRTFQPYVGAGIGAGIAHIGDTSMTRSDSDVAAAWSVLVGLRAFVTPKIAVFGEYKYTGASLHFDQAFPPEAGFDAGGFSGNYRAQHILGGLSYHF
ncbi:MAG: outer membrane beta-barrel protein [Nitrospira sp.]|nr:outer membrane beta-barrel protein [Nitrospira sp.]